MSLPGYYNIDAELYKHIHFNERYSLQPRLEAFNVLNHANLFVVPEETDVSAFSENETPFIRAQRGVFPSGNPERRNVQLAVKFLF